MHIMISEKVNNAQTRIEAFGDKNIDPSNYIINVHVYNNDTDDDFTESMSYTFPSYCNPFDVMYSVLDAMAENMNAKNAPYDAYWSCRKLAISLNGMRK